MFLVEKDIKDLVKDGHLILHGYDESNVNPVSYDITVDATGYYDNSIYIRPGKYCIVKSKEVIQVPGNCIAKVVEKNSMVRMGLMVTGPVYQPGHKTCCWLRVQNLSCQTLCIWSGLPFAQLMFETIWDMFGDREYDGEYQLYPDVTDASFNNEIDDYKGLGNYERIYDFMTQFKKLDYIKWLLNKKPMK